jgi:hypothetical protein
MTRLINIKVHPGSKQNLIATNANGDISVWVTAQPERNKANQACLQLLAEHLGVSVSQLTITRGATGRRKTISVNGA